MEETQVDQLIAGCLQQNRNDQRLLYKTFYGLAMSICIRYSGNYYEAKEIMNHGFMKVFTNLHKYHQNQPLKAWIKEIMINTATDHHRRNLRTVSTSNIDVAVNIEHHELQDHNLSYNDLVTMIQQLPGSYRTVFNLFAIEGYSHKEISKKLRITTGTSKSSLFKARERLKKMIL